MWVESVAKHDRYPDVATGDASPSAGGWDAQMACAKRLGFTLVRGVVCLRKITDPKHRDGGDTRTEAEYNRLSRAPHCGYHIGMDHPRLWRTSEGELFITADEYHLNLATLDRVRAQAEELGLRVEVTAKSFYNPGRTIMIVVTRSDSATMPDGPPTVLEVQSP